MPQRKDQELRRYSYLAWNTLAVSIAAGLLLTVLLDGCGGGEEKARRERERVATEKMAEQNKGGTLTEDVLDTLRVMKERLRITKDEYWEGQGGVLANDYFELWYPPGGVTVSHGMFAFQQLVNAKRRFFRFFGKDPGDHLNVVCEATMISFAENTGLDWWVYYEYKLDKAEIVFQPIDVLYQRNLGDVAVPRGYHQWGIGRLSGDRAPRWFSEGLSSMMADEEWFLENFLIEFPGEDVKMSFVEIDSALKKKSDRKNYRFALYNAFRMVRRLSASHGQDKLAEAVRLMGSGQKPKKAFKNAFGLPYDELVAHAMDFKVDR